MKIIVNCLTLKKGGTERVISNLVNDYLVHGHHISLVTATIGDIQYEFDNRVQIIRLDKREKQAKQNKFIRFLRRRKALNKQIKILQPNLIISFLPEPNFLVLSLTKKYNFKTVISVRNDPNIEYKNIFYNVLMRMLYKQADGIVLQTIEAKEYFKFSDEIYNKSIIISNPVSNAFLSYKIGSNRDNRIVTVGRLFKQKNHKLLINSFYSISEEFPSITLHIYGDGILKNELVEQISKLGLNQRVFLEGITNNLIEEIYNARIFVLSSDYEGMPNSLLEALALGIPSISTDCEIGGPRALIKHNYNGLLVSPNSEEQLSKAIETLLSDNKLSKQFSSISKDYISSKFSSANIFKQWESFISKIINE